MPNPDILTGEVRDWRDVMLRLQQLTCKDNGSTVVTVHIVTDRGMPKLWTVNSQKVEPASAAKIFIECLLAEGK